MTVSEDWDLSVLEKELGHSFGKRELLEQALTHVSYVNVHLSLGLESNEKMAYLGDAVLYLALSEHQYRNSKGPVGDWTITRQKFVNNEQLAEAARQVHMNRYIRLAPGVEDPNATGILATAYEAVIGAIFLDTEYEKAASFIRKSLLSIPSNGPQLATEDQATVGA